MDSKYITRDDFIKSRFGTKIKVIMSFCEIVPYHFTQQYFFS